MSSILISATVLTFAVMVQAQGYPVEGTDTDTGIDTGNDTGNDSIDNETQNEDEILNIPINNNNDDFGAFDDFDDFEDETPDEADDITSQDTQNNGEESELKQHVHLHGTVENQLMGMWLRKYNGDEHVMVNDYTRIKLMLDADMPGGLQLRSSAVAKLFVGDTEQRIVDIVPPGPISSLLADDPRWEMAKEEKYKLENEYYIDTIYLKIPISKAMLTIGKQPLSQGAGYVWNPTDVFIKKDMFDPSYQKPGIVAARLMIPIGEIASFDLVGQPKDISFGSDSGSIENWTAGGRASIRLGPLSLSGASYVTRIERTNLAGSMDAMMEAAAMPGADPYDAILRETTRRVMVGGDAILDVEGVRFWAEGAYNFVDEKEGTPKSWWELDGGVEYFFPFETHVMLEYYHYDAGPDQHNGRYSYNSWMRVLSGEIDMLGRDFLYESIDHPIDFWTLGLSSFQSLSDGSAAIMADIKWDFVQDAQLWLMVGANLGEREDYLSSTRGQAWLRLTADF